MTKSSGDGGNSVIVGSTLASRENGFIYTFLEVFGVLKIFAEEDETSTGTTKGFMAEKG